MFVRHLGKSVTAVPLDKASVPMEAQPARNLCFAATWNPAVCVQMLPPSLLGMIVFLYSALCREANRKVGQSGSG